MTKQDRIREFNEKSYETTIAIHCFDEDDEIYAIHLYPDYIDVKDINKLIRYLTEAKEIMEMEDE